MSRMVTMIVVLAMTAEAARGMATTAAIVIRVVSRRTIASTRAAAAARTTQ